MHLLSPTDHTLDRLAKRLLRTDTPRPANDRGGDPYWQRLSDALLDQSVHFVS